MHVWYSFLIIMSQTGKQTNKLTVYTSTYLQQKHKLSQRLSMFLVEVITVGGVRERFASTWNKKTSVWKWSLNCYKSKSTIYLHKSKYYIINLKSILIYLHKILQLSSQFSPTDEATLRKIRLLCTFCCYCGLLSLAWSWSFSSYFVM